MSKTPQLSASVDERFAEFHSADCNSLVRAEIERIIREGSDLDCYKVSVPRIARQCGAPLGESLRAFLFATQIGIFDLNYDVYCPSCRGNTEYAKHLMGLDTHSHCNLCSLGFELDFLDQIEVTFTVNPNIRTIDVKDFSERDYDDKIDYFEKVVAREGRRPVVSDRYEPGDTKTMRGTLVSPTGYVMYVPRHHDIGCVIEVRGEPAEQVQTMRLQATRDGRIVPQAIEVRPGDVDLEVNSDYPERWPFVVMDRGTPNNWMSAAYVTSQQDFRDLFSGEFLAPGVSFAIRNTTLMFTDIKQSTELFEELGDSAAYALVEDHFQVMANIIRKWEGGIVKTMGDAVMASFAVNRNAVGAACDIQRAFVEEPIKNRFIEVKIGLHRGPTIAVTSNRSLDYFGLSVNIAARVQGKSEAHQLLVSDAVMSDPQVSALLAERKLTSKSFNTSLKGLEDAFQLHAVS